MSIKVVKYVPKYKEQWDAFVKHSKNATFMLQRDYIEYHHIRFKDYSLLFFDDKNQVIALLPANEQENLLVSHGGLTYGGMVYGISMTQPLILAIFSAMIAYLLQENMQQLIYKTIPRIYHKGPADEDRYALFLLNALLMRRDSLTVIDRDYPIPFQKRRLRAVNKSKVYQFVIQETQDYSAYWELLANNLKEKHGVRPVHTLEEIHLLASYFPEHIKLIGCYGSKNQLLAGVVIYETEKVAHFQYIGASQEGKVLGALDTLFATLLQEYYVDKKYIDFGISNEKQGRILNQGLIDFKEGFGGRTIEHDFYQIPLHAAQMDLLERAIL